LPIGRSFYSETSALSAKARYVQGDIGVKMIELIARRFRALGEPYRLRILQKLQMGEKTVGELVTELDGNQSNVSKHLKIMYETGLVSRRRLGMSVSYAISDPTIFQLCSLVSRSEAQRREQELEELSGNVSAKTQHEEALRTLFT